MATILIVEDDPENLQTYADTVSLVERELGIEFPHRSATTFEEAQKALERGLEYPEEAPILILLDMEILHQGRKDSRAGYRLMKQYREKFADAYWIPLTANMLWHKKETPGEHALFDDLYSLQPFVFLQGKSGELKESVRRALQLIQEAPESRPQSEHAHTSEAIMEFDGTLYAIPNYRLYNEIRSVAELTRDVLLFGEPGTGKIYRARLIHHYSRRRNNEFLSVDGALDAKLLEELLFPSDREDTGSILSQAKDGTLYISNFDLLGNSGKEVSLTLQRKLLHYRKYRRYDVRIIGGVDKDRKGFPMFGTILPELLDSMIPIDLPPLRDRMEDIPVLLELFLEQFNREREAQGEKPKHLIDLPKIYKLLQAQDWRDRNISQLRVVVEEVLSNTPTLAITTEDFARVLEAHAEQPFFTSIEVAPDTRIKGQTKETIEVTTETGEKRQVKITKPPIVITDEELRDFESKFGLL